MRLLFLSGRWLPPHCGYVAFLLCLHLRWGKKRDLWSLFFSWSLQSYRTAAPPLQPSIILVTSLRSVSPNILPLRIRALMCKFREKQFHQQQQQTTQFKESTRSDHLRTNICLFLFSKFFLLVPENSRGRSYLSLLFSHSVVMTLCDPMNRSTPGLPVHHQLLEFTQTHVHRVGNAIQPSHPLSSPSPPTFNPSQHQGVS